MVVANRRVYEAQFALGAKVQSSLGKGFGQVQKGLKGIQNQAAAGQKSILGMSGAIKKMVGVAAGYLSLRAAYGFVKEGIGLASDLVEVQNVVDTTFRESANQINTWSKAALKTYGLSELQAKQYTGTIGAMLKSSGIGIEKISEMSTAMAGLTGDIASFYNLDHETAFQKIRSGLSGETEPLKQLGINMSVANLQAFALTQGVRKSWNQLSQAQQVLLRYNYLLKVTGDVQGDFAKNIMEYANQQRIYQTNIKQFSANMASKFLPLVNKGVITLNKLFDSSLPDRVIAVVEKMSSGAEWVIKNWSKIAPVIEAVTVALVANKAATLVLVGAQKAGLVIQTLTKAWTTAAAALALLREGNTLAAVAQAALNGTMWACPATWIVAGITAIAAGAYLLIKNWDKVKNFFVKLWEKIKPIFEAIGGFFGKIFGGGGKKTVEVHQYAKGPNPQPVGSQPKPQPSPVGGLSSRPSPYMMGVPQYATGTRYHPGGPAIVGERGREMINLPRGSQVTPNNRTEQLLNGLSGGAGGGMSLRIEQNFYGPADREEVKQANRESMSEFERKFNELMGSRRRLQFA